MNKVNRALIKLLSISMDCQMSSAVELEAEEWQQLYEEAVAHQVQSIIFSEANKYGATKSPELFNKWKNSTIIHVLKYGERFTIIGELLNALENAGIRVMVLKGLHYRYLYNDPVMRTMGDVDLLVMRQSLNAAVDIIKSFDYIKVKHDDPKHISLVHRQYVPIELHFSLFTEAKRKIAVSFNKEIWELSYHFEQDGLRFLVPSRENQLLYCCIHMTNHFGKCGFGLRQLSDFYLLARNHSQAIDWDILLSKADLYGIGRFMEIMLIICHKLFNLPVSETIHDKYSQDTDKIEQMIGMILDAGVFGEKDKIVSANRTMASYISRSKPGVGARLRYIFPLRENLNDEYSYAQKYKYLLPVAWIHRIAVNVKRKDMSLAEKLPDSKAIDKYVKLFRWIDIKRN